MQISFKEKDSTIAMLNDQLKKHQTLLASTRRQLIIKSSQFERLRKEFFVSNKKHLSTTEQKETPDKSSLLAAQIEVRSILLPTPSNQDLSDDTNDSMDVENDKDSNLVPEANLYNKELAILNADEKMSADEPEKEAINKDYHKDDLVSEQVETTNTSEVNLVPEANSISQKDDESAIFNADEKMSASEPEKEAINKDSLNDYFISELVETTNTSVVNPVLEANSISQQDNEIAILIAVENISTDETKKEDNHKDDIISEQEAIVTKEVVKPDQTVVSEPSITSEPEQNEQDKEALTVTESEVITAQTSDLQEQSQYPCDDFTASETSTGDDICEDKTDTITETNTELLDWFLQQ